MRAEVGNHARFVVLPRKPGDALRGAVELQHGCVVARRVAVVTVEDSAILASFDVLATDGGSAGVVMRHYPRRRA